MALCLSRVELSLAMTMLRLHFMKPFSLRKIFCFSLFVLLFATIHSENFRVRKVIPITLSEIDQKISVESGINDSLFVTLPSDLTYVSGVELNFKIPEIIATWRDSVAYMVYENLSPAPDSKNLDYYGERVHISTIPGKLSLTLQIPISNDFSIKESPYSVKLPPTSEVKNGIFLRFMMVMKGVPENLEDSILEITAKPLLKNLGALHLDVILPHSDENIEKTYSVFIDDKPIQKSEFKNKLFSTGEHHLSVVSDSFRNELRTFRIEQAKTTSLSVTLRSATPLLKITCPKDTQVFLDGEPISDFTMPLAVSQGEHTVRFILGDYEVTKAISAMNGRTYSVNLNVDASISEEE